MPFLYVYWSLFDDIHFVSYDYPSHGSMQNRPICVFNLYLFCKKTFVSRFITNKLFGKGRRWNGKAFDIDSGSNRFENFQIKKDRIDDSRTFVTLKTEYERNFFISVAPSVLFQGDVVLLEYSKDHGFLSLWRSMKDEIRILPGSNGNILVGLGCMAWSGGMLNCQPFCLYRKRT